MAPSIAVVIPTLDEEDVLAALLESLREQSVAACRVVVADGGSTDRTTEIARHMGAEVLEVHRSGRGGQIAAAVEMLDADVVLVLHADMKLPRQAIERGGRWLAEHLECPGGCLGHRFASGRMVCRWIELWDLWRARRGGSYGDQAQFFRRELIQQSGGFPDQPIMEDVELARRLRQFGRPAYLNLPVEVSARRIFERGWLRTMLMNWSLRCTYRRHGTAACSDIYRRYYGDRG